MFLSIAWGTVHVFLNILQQVSYSLFIYLTLLFFISCHLQLDYKADKGWSLIAECYFKPCHSPVALAMDAASGADVMLTCAAVNSVCRGKSTIQATSEERLFYCLKVQERERTMIERFSVANIAVVELERPGRN